MTSDLCTMGLLEHPSGCKGCGRCYYDFMARYWAVLLVMYTERLAYWYHGLWGLRKS